MKTENVKVSSISHGDTVVVNGNAKTVGKYDAKAGAFGTTLFGFRGCETVERVLYPKFYKGVLLGFVAQP